MRKAIAWLLIALMALQCAAFAEGTAASTAVTAVNGADAVRTASDIYLSVPAGEQEMLVRVPLGGGDPVCVDRADDFEDLMPYSGGVAYLKTTAGSSAIMQCVGNEVSTVYAFGAATATNLSAYGSKLLVLTSGLLHSVEPSSQLCLKLSGAEMLDYVLGDGCAYFLSAGDRMEYTAQLTEGEAAKQAGCVYRLDLNTGETTLLLKSGGEDLKIYAHNLYFHNLADAYAVRTADATELLGRVYSLDVQLKTLNAECTEPDNGFWPLEKGLVTWYNGALNMNTEAGVLALYTPENGACVASDGSELYVWESGLNSLTEIQPTGTAQVIYSGDLTQAIDASLMTPEPTVTPEPTPEASASSDQDSTANAAWYDQFMENKELASGSSSSGSSSSGSSSAGSNVVWAEATPIGWTTPTPAPVSTFNPSLGSVSGGSSSSGSSSGSSSSGSGSSSGSNQSTGKTYSVDISYLKITGGSVNIRSKAGLNGSVIATAAQGTVLKCAGVASKDSNGLVWYKVTNNGKTGWVSSRYAKKTSSSSSSSSSSGSQAGPTVDMSGDYVKIVNGSVTLRSKANKESSALGTIAKGTTVTFLGKASTDSRGVVWFKVQYKGETGWVSSKYAQITNSAGTSTGGGASTSGTKVKIVNGSVTIRSKANKESAKLGAIAQGKTATYLGKSSTDSRGIKWFYIEYKGVKGWVSSMYAKLV